MILDYLALGLLFFVVIILLYVVIVIHGHTYEIAKCPSCSRAAPVRDRERVRE